MTNPTRILVAGDTHCNDDEIYRLGRKAKERGCNAIFQVGDFGYDFRAQFIDACLEVAAEIPIYWIDGNHDDHDSLEEMGAFGADDFVETWDNIFYVPRGHSWEWEGVKFVGLGGAHSIDYQMRRAHVSWWEQERITLDEAGRAESHGSCDVMFTHDVPVGVPHMDRFVQGYKDDQQSTANRTLLKRVVETLNPKLLIHGHMHHSYLDWFKDTFVIGLDRDDQYDDVNITVLDLTQWNSIKDSISRHEVPVELVS